jgi:hypothetical protein
MRELPRMLKVSEVMNTHGSVSSMGTNGLVVSNTQEAVKQVEDGPEIK